LSHVCWFSYPGAVFQDTSLNQRESPAISVQYGVTPFYQSNIILFSCVAGQYLF